MPGKSLLQLKTAVYLKTLKSQIRVSGSWGIKDLHLNLNELVWWELTKSKKKKRNGTLTIFRQMSQNFSRTYTGHVSLQKTKTLFLNYSLFLIKYHKDHYCSEIEIFFFCLLQNSEKEEQKTNKQTNNNNLLVLKIGLVFSNTQIHFFFRILGWNMTWTFFHDIHPLITKGQNSVWKSMRLDIGSTFESKNQIC